MKPVEDDRTAPEIYTSCYCEENIALLAQRLLQMPTEQPSAFYIVFISSAVKAVPMWNQRSGKDNPDVPVLWDYHVVLLQKRSPLNGGSLIYDYDTTLAFPISADEYIELSFRPSISIRPEYKQLSPMQQPFLFVSNY